MNDSDTDDDTSTGVSYNAVTGEIRYDNMVVATLAVEYTPVSTPSSLHVMVVWRYYQESKWY